MGRPSDSVPMHILEERHGGPDGRLSNVELGKVCEPMEERCEPSIRQTKAIAPEGGPLTWKILCTVMFAFRAGVRITPRGEDGYGKVGERGRLTQAGIDLRPLSLQGVGGFHATLGAHRSQLRQPQGSPWPRRVALEVLLSSHQLEPR